MQTSLENPVSTIVDVNSPLEHRSIQPSEFYEAAILADETIVSNYWDLGVSYLLAGRDDDAQAAWFAPLSMADETEVDIYTDELLAVLEREARYQAQIPDLEIAWSIRQHIWLLQPDLIDNILRSIVLASEIDRLTSALLVEWQIDELLTTATNASIDDNLLEETIAALLKKIRTDFSLKIIRSCLDLMGDSRNDIVPKLVFTAFQLFHQRNLGLFSVGLVEICLSFFPDDLGIHQVLAGLYSGVDLHTKAIATAEQHYQLAKHEFQQIFGSYLVQRAYLSAGNWNGCLERLEQHRELLNKIINSTQDNSDKIQQNLIISSFFSPYIEDNPSINKPLQNQLAAICQHNLKPLIIESEFEELSLAKKPGVLRIGYLASTLKEHSVGWLSRWLFHYHDRTSFEIFTYCVNQSQDNSFNHKWFRDKVDISYYFNGAAEEIAAQIKLDEIDILIDLDSLTFDLSCVVMAYKPAPVQATWLGLDASGLPAIDYFIVDDYVLPDNAQDYYQEKLWRLPRTYLAVDGFEVGIPTLNRRDLNIPDDAIVYFSSQSGYKRHPDNIRCQLKIIKNVPNSYFLIKGKSDPDMIRDFFGKIAAEEGVSLDRLRFLDGVRDEYIHRANLAIADVVLDTFPYNGATTTLETLWMGIPMVTQVGEQFAARNSYTFMLNAGIEEGIAWSEQEYVEWGTKLGLDRQLRDTIQGKLRSGRTTAPVWNAKQFTLEMEQAYRQMWAKYQEQSQQEAVVDYSNN
jgi:predicted O-linked N-acetylglucosamine transferase (SPINDLY family)